VGITLCVSFMEILPMATDSLAGRLWLFRRLQGAEGKVPASFQVRFQGLIRI
jgi:hypothetical protein